MLHLQRLTPERGRIDAAEPLPPPLVRLAEWSWHDLAVAPLVLHDRVVLSLRSHELVGCALESGRELWRAPPPCRDVHARRRGFEVVSDGKRIVAAGDEGVVVLDSGTGAELCRLAEPGPALDTGCPHRGCLPAEDG